MFVNYNGSVLSYVASIRKYFGLNHVYDDDPSLTAILNEQRPEKVFVLLVDGMGANLIRKKLPKDSFLVSNMLASPSTVFPSTTTAATTSIRNGRPPCENGWLGWMQYLEEVDDIVIPFRSMGYYNEITYEGDIFRKYVPVTTTEQELNRIGVPSRILFPSFEEDGCEDFDEMCCRLADLSYSQYRYVYAYWDKYDTYMHEHGPSSRICDSYLEHINYEIEELVKNLNKDTLLVVTADHGQVDIRRFYNLWNSEFDRFFARRPSLEQRAMAFKIRKGMEREFEKLFKQRFEDDYVLLSKAQVMESHLFGDRPNHPRFEQFIGDYVAIAKSDLVLIYKERGNLYYSGQHAGICDDELYVPIIVARNGTKLISK
ncbi:MAG: alkaline phosphatase family protein [Erysipelotrichaceae bacterium]|nr:alkaline phosphatase family protein [Erysipelotrichaceae bacterium]